MFDIAFVMNGVWRGKGFALLRRKSTSGTSLIVLPAVLVIYVLIVGSQRLGSRQVNVVGEFSSGSNGCARYVIYDTPPHAHIEVTKGLSAGLASQGGLMRCERRAVDDEEGCGELLRRICNGTLTGSIVGSVGRIIGHGDGELGECIRERGYVIVTATMPPLQRWTLMYSHTLSEYSEESSLGMTYLQFMRRYPDCSLLHYYDGRGEWCADDWDVQSRIERIVSWFDESLDMALVNEGSVGQKMKGVDWKEVREGPREKFRSFLEMGRLRGERGLWEGLRRRRGRVSVC